MITDQRESWTFEVPVKGKGCKSEKKKKKNQGLSTGFKNSICTQVSEKTKACTHGVFGVCITMEARKPHSNMYIIRP